MNKIRKIIVVTFLVSLSIIIGSSRPTMAASLEESPEFQKALATSLSACYTRGAFRDEITLSSYGATGSVKSVLASTSSNVSAPIPYGYTSSSVQLPSMSCSDILSRALSKKGLSMPAKFEDAGPVLTKLGYTQVTSVDLDNEKTCFWFEYDVNVDDVEWIAGGGEYRTRDEVWRSKQVCLVEYTDESSGKAMTRLDSINSDNGGNSKILDIVRADSNTSVIKFQTQSWGVNDDWVSLDAHRNGTAADFMLTMYNAIIATKHGQTGTGEAGSYVNRYTLKGYQDQSSPIGSNVAGTRYVIQAGAAKTVPEDLFGVTRLFDQTNTYVLYQNYLMKFYGAMTLQVNPNDPTQDSLRTGASKDLGGYKKVKVYNKGKVEECYVKPNKTSGKLYGVSNNRFGGIDDATWQYPSPVFQVGYDDIIKFLNSTTPSGSELKSSSDYIVDANCAVDGQQEQTKPSNPGGGGGSSSSNTPENGGSDIPCFEAAKSLGWILCPVLEIAGGAAQKMYTIFEDDFLQVNAELLDPNGGSRSTHDGWVLFRNFANTVFIIVFLIVILSQITGIGINNYGIKKILPRLIMVVILTNLSFVICQLAVDISNIVGAQLYQLFSGWAVQVGSSYSFTFGDIVNEIVTSLLIAGGATGVGLLAAGSWEFWLIPLLLAILAGIISVLFFLIILGVRQAGIIILIVLSPIAIVLYALPNTKSIFDRWRKMLTSLLLVYPICGALMGGGQFASALLVSAGGDKGFFFVLVAMLLSVVPFFMIPSIVRSSMTAMGNLGTRIAGFGQRFSRGISGMVRNSEGARSLQRDLDMHNAGRTVNRLNRREARRGHLSHAQQLRRSRALSRGIALQEEDMRAAADTRAFPSSRTPEGQAALDAMQAKIFDDAMKSRVEEEEAAYRNSTTFDVNSVSDLEAEHARLIDALDANPDDARAQAQMRAIQNLLMAQGDPGQETIFKNYMRRAALGGDSEGLHAAARHIASDGKYMQKIKAEDKGLFSAINHFKTGDFSHAGSGASAYYGAQGAGSYTAQTLAAADLGAIDRLVEGVTTGAIRGGDLRKLTSLANEALSNPNLQLKGDVRQKLENLAAAGYSVGGSTIGVSSAGSTALSGASLETLDSMVQRIRAINGGAAFTGTPTAPGAALDEYNEVQAMARNAERALRNPNTPHDAATVDRLQDILMAAQDMGVKDASGADFNRVDPAAIKIRGVEKRTAPPPPPGWEASGIWNSATGGSPAPNKQQQIAYQEWAKKAAEVDMWNKEHGF